MGDDVILEEVYRLETEQQMQVLSLVGAHYETFLKNSNVESTVTREQFCAFEWKNLPLFQRVEGALKMEVLRAWVGQMQSRLPCLIWTQLMLQHTSQASSLFDPSITYDNLLFLRRSILQELLRHPPKKESAPMRVVIPEETRLLLMQLAHDKSIVQEYTEFSKWYNKTYGKSGLGGYTLEWRVVVPTAEDLQVFQARVESLERLHLDRTKSKDARIVRFLQRLRDTPDIWPLLQSYYKIKHESTLKYVARAIVKQDATLGTLESVLYETNPQHIIVKMRRRHIGALDDAILGGMAELTEDNENLLEQWMDLTLDRQSLIHAYLDTLPLKEQKK